MKIKCTNSYKIFLIRQGDSSDFNNRSHFVSNNLLMVKREDLNISFIEKNNLSEELSF